MYNLNKLSHLLIKEKLDYESRIVEGEFKHIEIHCKTGTISIYNKEFDLRFVPSSYTLKEDLDRLLTIFLLIKECKEQA